MSGVGINSFNFTPKQQKTETSAVVSETPKRKTSHSAFNDKYRSNKKMSKTIGTGLLLAGTAIAVYKGHGKISEVLSKISKESGKAAKKFPNLSQAGKSLSEAAKTPKKYIGKVFSAVKKPIAAAGKAIAGFFTKKS